MDKQLESDSPAQDEPQVPMNREERRKKHGRPELDQPARNQMSDRLRDTRNRASFVRRLGPR